MSKKEEKGEVIEINETENVTEEVKNEGIEVEGVAGMSGGFAGGITEVLSGKKNLAKGIKVDINDKKAKLDINIIVEYGTRIPDVAYEIQNRVKKSVETMTGLTVEEVNVHVQGVKTDTAIQKEQESKEEKNEEE